MKANLSLIASFVLVWLNFHEPAAAADWPRFRGEGLAATSEEAVLTHWPTNGPAVVWQACRFDKTDSYDGGYGSFAVVQGVVYVLAAGRCYALDAATGKVIWRQNKRMGGNSTPTFYEGRIYIHGGGFNCLDAATGKVLWATQDDAHGGIQSPWVEAGRVFISINDQYTSSSPGSLKAYHATSGALLWQCHSNPAGYSSPVGATIHGVRQIIYPGIRGLLAVDPETGQKLWFYKATDLSYGPSPIVCGDIVIARSQALRINHTNDTFSATLLWSHDRGWEYYDTAVSYKQSVYLSVKGSLACRDLETGHLNWETNVGKYLGSPVTITLAQDKLILLGGSLRLAMALANPEKYEEICRSPGATWSDGAFVGTAYNSPALADGRLFFRGNAGVKCVNLDPRPALVLAAACSHGATQLVISNRNGTEITAAQAANIDLFWSPNPGLPLAQWERVSPALDLTNGVMQFFESAELAYPSRFYRATETTRP